MANYILKEMAEGMADGHKTLYPKMLIVITKF